MDLKRTYFSSVGNYIYAIWEYVDGPGRQAIMPIIKPDYVSSFEESRKTSYF